MIDARAFPGNSMIDAIKFVLYDRREGISRKLERTPTFTYVIYAHTRAHTRTCAHTYTHT